MLPLLQNCFCFVFNERDFTLSLSDNNQTDNIETFNSTCTSRYLDDDLLYIDNPYFEQMLDQIYPMNFG